MIKISCQELNPHQKISVTTANESFRKIGVRRGHTSLEDFAMSAKAGGAIGDGAGVGRELKTGKEGRRDDDERREIVAGLLRARCGRRWARIFY